MEWFIGKGNNEVDIGKHRTPSLHIFLGHTMDFACDVVVLVLGYVPRLELRSPRPSSVMENGTELNTTEVDSDPDHMEWNEEISLEEAKSLLEKAMYPFKKVNPLLPPSLMAVLVEP